MVKYICIKKNRRVKSEVVFCIKNASRGQGQGRKTCATDHQTFQEHCTSVGFVLSSLYGRQRIMIILFCFFIAPGDF